MPSLPTDDKTTKAPKEMGRSIPIPLPTGLVPVPSDPAESDSSLAPVRALSEPIRQGLDLIQLGCTITEAGKQVGRSTSALHSAMASEEGRLYMALQQQALETWMKGMLFQAAAVIGAELTSPMAATRLRAAEALFKHLGGFLGVGKENSEDRLADATATARALLEAANINININTGGAAEPSVKIIGDQT